MGMVLKFSWRFSRIYMLRKSRRSLTRFALGRKANPNCLGGLFCNTSINCGGCAAQAGTFL
jgi:hypothetical protein